jgi:hypothetical protein
VPQNSLDLFAGHSGEPFQKIVHAGAIFQVRKEGLHWNARSSENPGAADFPGISLHRRALFPIKHKERLPDLTNAKQPQDPQITDH